MQLVHVCLCQGEGIASHEWGGGLGQWGQYRPPHPNSSVWTAHLTLTSPNSALLFPAAASLLGKNFYPVKGEILCERDYVVSLPTCSVPYLAGIA